MVLSVDWAFKKPICTYNGKDVKNIIIDLENRDKSMDELLLLSRDNGSKIVVENLPYMYQRFLLKNNIQVFNIHPNTVKIYTESTGIRKNPDYEEKSDEYDAKAIYTLYAEHPEYFFEARLNNTIDELKDKISEWNDIEKLRVSMTNRVRARGEIPENNDSVRTLTELEETYKKKVQKILEIIPIYNEFFSKVKGCGVRISGYLIAGIDIRKAHNTSAVIKYCGMGVTDGKADRAKSGQTLGYNPKLKTICYLLGEQFVRHKGSKYRELYDRAKERYKNSERFKQDKAGHIDRMARRIAVKQFLSDLHYHWRTLEGLPVEKPYAITMLGHKHYITPNPEKLEIINLP